MENRKLTYGYIRSLPTGEERTVRFVASTESLDRHNSIIKSEGWDLEAYRKNPIVGWDHDVYGGWRAADPDNIIGRADVKVENSELIADITFEDELVNKKADKIFRKVKGGTLNAVSVGFLPVKEHRGDPEAGEVRDATYYDAVELVEISAVPIGSNRDAVKNALKSGTDISELVKEIVSEALGDEYNEKLTLKGLFSILGGGDAGEVEKADAGEVDEEARRRHLAYVKAKEDAIKSMSNFLITTK